MAEQASEGYILQGIERNFKEFDDLEKRLDLLQTRDNLSYVRTCCSIILEKTKYLNIVKRNEVLEELIVRTDKICQKLETEKESFQILSEQISAIKDGTAKNINLDILSPRSGEDRRRGMFLQAAGQRNDSGYSSGGGVNMRYGVTSQDLGCDFTDMMRCEQDAIENSCYDMINYTVPIEETGEGKGELSHEIEIDKPFPVDGLPDKDSPA